jgi:hypothetical protein
VAAARGRQHPAARVAPPQTLMGCSPIVAAAQPVLYNILTRIYRFIAGMEFNCLLFYSKCSISK